MGVRARADAGAETQVGRGRGRATIDLTRVDEADDAEIAETIARLDRRFVDAAATDRVEIRVLRPQFLIAEAAHRTAAAGIETPRRREPFARGAQDRADAHAARDDDAVGHRIIAANVEPPARIGREFAAQRPFGLDRSEEHTSELQSLMRISYAVFCLKKKKKNKHN